MDTRAQSMGIARFLLGILVAAPVIWIVNDVTDPILDGAANATSNTQANTATTWMQDWIAWFPVLFLLISAFGLVVYAVFVREVKG